MALSDVSISGNEMLLPLAVPVSSTFLPVQDRPCQVHVFWIGCLTCYVDILTWYNRSSTQTEHIDLWWVIDVYIGVLCLTICEPHLYSTNFIDLIINIDNRKGKVFRIQAPITIIYFYEPKTSSPGRAFVSFKSTSMVKISPGPSVPEPEASYPVHLYVQ